jgi:hypothetical protein
VQEHRFYELSKLGVCYRQGKESKRWQVTKGRMLDNVIVSHFTSESNGWVGRPFDPSTLLKAGSAQDKLTTSGTPEPDKSLLLLIAPAVLEGSRQHLIG